MMLRGKWLVTGLLIAAAPLAGCRDNPEAKSELGPLDDGLTNADPAVKGAVVRPKLLEGGTDWPAVMAALDNVGYTGWAITEQPGNQAADVETARDMIQRMDRMFAL